MQSVYSKTPADLAMYVVEWFQVYLSNTDNFQTDLFHS